ncbi:hypothetical protein EJ04DRAFT_527259 [Polyplosphaeria fusca]|uniref:Uncharacterized protein n=1 Tax=Polyplosphaeria fusca TaxID=682080 RepID=A0A9P4QRH5_9PLEO|nr:hypothetical protein EJ04DRAFT_527259 [Polyplosphaeria fusca]
MGDAAGPAQETRRRRGSRKRDSSTMEPEPSLEAGKRPQCQIDARLLARVRTYESMRAATFALEPHRGSRGARAQANERAREGGAMSGRGQGRGGRGGNGWWPVRMSDGGGDLEERLSRWWDPWWTCGGGGPGGGQGRDAWAHGQQPTTADTASDNATAERGAERVALGEGRPGRVQVRCGASGRVWACGPTILSLPTHRGFASAGGGADGTSGREMTRRRLDTGVDTADDTDDDTDNDTDDDTRPFARQTRPMLSRSDSRVPR